MSEHTEPPATIKEVGIHIGYMREDISDLKKLVAENIQNAATKVEVAELEKRVSDLEKKDDSQRYFTRLEGRAVSGVLAIGIALLTLWNLISKG